MEKRDRQDNRSEHEQQVLEALTVTPDMALSPLEGFVYNRVEQFVRAHDVPMEAVDAVREAYLAGLLDASRPIVDIRSEVLGMLDFYSLLSRKPITGLEVRR